MSEVRWEEELPLFFSVPIAAKTLNVSVITVRSLIRDGSLPCHRFGRKLKIQRQDLIDYVQKSKISKEDFDAEETGSSINSKRI